MKLGLNMINNHIIFLYIIVLKQFFAVNCNHGTAWDIDLGYAGLLQSSPIFSFRVSHECPIRTKKPKTFALGLIQKFVNSRGDLHKLLIFYLVPIQATHGYLSFFGGSCWTRTNDQGIMSPLL